MQDLISNEILQRIYDEYGHVSINLLDAIDKEAVTKEALPKWQNQDAISDFFADNSLAPIFWMAPRAGCKKVIESLYAAMESDLQDCADTWEGGL